MRALLLSLAFFKVLPSDATFLLYAFYIFLLYSNNLHYLLQEYLFSFIDLAMKLNMFNDSENEAS